MPRRLLAAFAAVALLASPLIASGSLSQSTTRAAATGKTASAGKKSAAPAKKSPKANCQVKRRTAPRVAFMRKTGYPHGRPGYRVDHIVPLACCGADDPSNMQWQTIAQAKAKDKVERIGCK